MFDNAKIDDFTKSTLRVLLVIGLTISITTGAILIGSLIVNPSVTLAIFTSAVVIATGLMICAVSRLDRM